MQAVRFVGVGGPAQIEDVPTPSAGPGQVLIRIGGAGVCHSDLHVMEEDLGFKPPFTLGHENAGWVSAIGDGVTGFKEGDAVAVYGPWGCGREGRRRLCETEGRSDHGAGRTNTRVIAARATGMYCRGGENAATLIRTPGRCGNSPRETFRRHRRHSFPCWVPRRCYGPTRTSTDLRPCEVQKRRWSSAILAA